MKRLREKIYLRNWPMAIKLSVIYSTLITLSILIISMSSFLIYRDSMEHQMKEYIPQILNKMGANIESYVSDLISVAQMPITGPYRTPIAEVIRTEESMAQYNSLANTIKMFQSLNFVNSYPTSYLRSVTVYTKYGYAYTRQSDTGGFWEYKPYHTQPWYSENAPITKLEMVGATKDYASGGIVYTLIQPIMPIGSADNYGYFEVSGSMQYISDLANTIDVGPYSKVFIMDHQDTIMYATGGDIETGVVWDNLYDLDWGSIPSNQGSRILTLDRQEYLLSYYMSEKSKWKIVAVIPMVNLSEGIEQVRSMIVLWVLLGVIVVGMISIIVAVTVTNPIRQLTRELEIVENSNFETRLKHRRLDEVIRLAGGLSKMGRRIHLLIDAVYKSTLLKQEAEINALQSQINPHFMNNVLETIRMMSREGKHKEVDEALSLLGSLTRYHTKQFGDLVTIETELGFVRNYLQLQKLRFADHLELLEDIQQDILHYQIPYLLIQPILENAIKHGQSTYDQHIRIYLKIYKEDSMIIISIVDEGPGISEDKLEQLQSQLEGTSSGLERIGLLNVYQRIQLIYNDEGSMFIHSEEGLGTKIVMKLPIREGNCDEGIDR